MNMVSPDTDHPMPGSPEPIPAPEPDTLEVAIDQAIAACDGDVRATVRALIVANGLPEAELSEMYATTSKGYARGRARRQG